MPVYKRKIKNKVKYFAQVNFVDLNGSYKAKNSKYFDTKREAEVEEIRLKANFTEVKQQSLTLDDIFESYFLHQKSAIKESTLSKYRPLYEHISKLLGDKKIDKLTKQEINLFKDDISNENLSTIYKNRILKFLKTLNKYAYHNHDVSNKLIENLSVFKNTESKEMNFFTEDEFNIFIDHIQDIKYKSFFLVLYKLGLRLGEANALTWSDIKEDKIIINKSLTTKLKGLDYKISTPKTKSSIRVLPIPQEVKDALNTLKTHYMEFVNFSESWFVFGGITPLKDTTITVQKDKAIKESKLKHIRIHDFRHSCASYYINKGASILLVSKLLGHASTKITLDTYSHLYPSELEQLII